MFAPDVPQAFWGALRIIFDLAKIVSRAASGFKPCGAAVPMLNQSQASLESIILWKWAHCKFPNIPL